MITVYVANDGEKHPIRLGSAAGTFNGPVDGTPTSNIKAKVSKTNREIGLRPRLVVLSREEEGRVLYRRVPCLTPSKFNSVAIGGTVTYSGKSWTCIGKIAEDY